MGTSPALYQPLGYMTLMRTMVLALACLLCGFTTAAHAFEPALARWTRITETTAPEHVVNYASMTEDEARELMARSRAAVLYDRSVGFDSIPADGIGLRSAGGVWGVFGAQRDAFRVALVGDDYGVFAAAVRRKDPDRRLDTPESPVRLVLGIPARTTRLGASRAVSYDPLVAVFGQSLFIAQYVNVRVADPLDPTRDSSQARVATATIVPFSTFLDDNPERWRIVVTLQRSGGQDPRVVLLPIDAEGRLELGRDGRVLRLTSDTNDNIVGGQAAKTTVVPRVVLLHFGDRQTLRDRLASMPPPPRERFVDPGGPGDPLMLGPRSARDPLGAGIEVRTGGQGELNLIPSNRTSSAVQPAFSGVVIEGWVGRVGAAFEGRSDLVAVRVGGRVGTMRDTNYTFIGGEVGSIAGSQFTTGPLGRLALNGVVQSRRLSQRTFFGLPFEMGNSFRAGTSGVEYELNAGLRATLGRGLVLTPSANGGFRYQLSRQRGFAIFGIGVEFSRNANVFKTRSNAREATPSPPLPAPEGHREGDPTGG